MGPWAVALVREDDVVTFVGDCPVDPEHPAEWTERREDTRSRASYWCPVCEAGPGTGVVALSAAPEGPSERSGAGIRPSARPGGNLGTQSVTEGSAA